MSAPVGQYQSYNAVASGEVAGSVSAAQMPNIPCAMAWVQAAASNTGKVYIGGAGVTVPNGTADATSGLELAPGTILGPLTIPNLSIFYYICDNAGDDVLYMVLK